MREDIQSIRDGAEVVGVTAKVLQATGVTIVERRNNRRSGDNRRGRERRRNNDRSESSDGGVIPMMKTEERGYVIAEIYIEVREKIKAVQCLSVVDSFRLLPSILFVHTKDDLPNHETQFPHHGPPPMHRRCPPLDDCADSEDSEVPPLGQVYI